VIGNAETLILPESAARQVFIHFNSGQNCLVAGVRERRERERRGGEAEGDKRES
jgi:hypothetical protein